MHRKRGSSGLNWKPHFILWTVDRAPPPCSGVIVLLVTAGSSVVS